MKKLALLFIILTLTPALTYAQKVTLTAPITRPSETQYVVTTITIAQASANIECAVQDGSNNETRRVTFVIPSAAQPTATVVGLVTAIDTAVAGETGSALRRANARILEYLRSTGYFAGTLVP